MVLFLFIITHLQVARALARRGRDSSGLTLLLSAFWGPLLLTFIISQWIPVYLERTLMVVVPALCLLFACGAARTAERYVNLILLLLVALVAMNALFNCYFSAKSGKSPFRDSAQFLQDEIEPGEPILHTSDGALLIFLHYAPDRDKYLLKGDPEPAIPVEDYPVFGGEIIAKEEIAASRFWLVVALDNSIEFQRDLAHWFHEHHELVVSYDVDAISLSYFDDEQMSQSEPPSCQLPCKWRPAGLF